MAERIVRGYGLYEQLREHKPALVIAIDGDGDEVKINVPDVRNKYARVMTSLREIAWVRCDLMDKKGGLIYRHHRNADDRDAPAGALEDMPVSRSSAEMAGMLNIMLRAQEVVLIRHQAAMQQVLDAQMRVLDAATRRMELQETQLQQAMQLNHALSSDLVNAQLAQLQLGAGPAVDPETGEERPQSDRAIDALMPAILRHAFAPPVKKPTPPTPEAPTSPKKDAPKNGAAKPASTGHQSPSSSSRSD